MKKLTFFVIFQHSPTICSYKATLPRDLKKKITSLFLHPHSLLFLHQDSKSFISVNFSQVTKSLRFVNVCCQDSALSFETAFMLQTNFRFRILLILLLPGFGNYSHEVTIPSLFFFLKPTVMAFGSLSFPPLPLHGLQITSPCSSPLATPSLPSAG